MPQADEYRTPSEHATAEGTTPDRFRPAAWLHRWDTWPDGRILRSAYLAAVERAQEGGEPVVRAMTEPRMRNLDSTYGGEHD
jgi:hypothetical protein